MSMEWDDENDPAESGWYPVIICYDAAECVFTSVDFWTGGDWKGKGVVAHGDRCGTEQEAKELAKANDNFGSGK